MVINRHSIPSVSLRYPDIPQNKTKDTGRQVAAPYEYAEKDNKPVGDGALDIPQNKTKNTGHQGSESRS